MIKFFGRSDIGLRNLNRTTLQTGHTLHRQLLKKLLPMYGV